MLLAAIIVVLVFAVTLVQATQGWFSAMIMTVLTLTCAALAFGTFDHVAVNYLAPYWKPSYAHAIALAVLFGVPLIVLRLVFDRAIRRTTLLPLIVDRVGAGVCGLITALTMVGVLAVTMHLVPFDRGSVLGYSRVEVADPAADKPAGTGQNNLWLSPDRFAVRLGTMLSAGIYGSGSSLYKDHPDLVQEAAWTNAVPTGVSRYAEPGSISVVGTELLPVLYRVVPPITDPKNNPPSYEPVEPSAGNEFRLVKMRLGEKAKDERKSHIFTLRQFRLSGRKPGSASMVEVHAIGIEQEQSDPTQRHIRFKKGRVDMPVVDNVYSPKGSDVVEVVFEIPKNFQPTHVSYKRGARVPVSFDTSTQGGEERPSREKREEVASTKPASPSTSATRPAPASGEAVARPSRGGNIRGITTKSGRSFFGDELPLELKNYRGSNVEHRGAALASGSLVAELDKQSEETSDPIRRFAVPEDQRLLQLSISKLEAKSTFGRIITQAVGTVENYFVTDSTGGRYEVVGKYAIANVNGTDLMELQYFGGAEAGIGRMRPFDRIKSDHLKGEYGYVLLFLVKPGAHITAFSSGGDATRADDLTAENLKAPQ